MPDIMKLMEDWNGYVSASDIQRGEGYEQKLKEELSDELSIIADVVKQFFNHVNLSQKKEIDASKGYIPFVNPYGKWKALTLRGRLLSFGVFLAVYGGIILAMTEICTCVKLSTLRVIWDSQNRLEKEIRKSEAMDI